MFKHKKLNDYFVAAIQWTGLNGSDVQEFLKLPDTIIFKKGPICYKDITIYEGEWIIYDKDKFRVLDNINFDENYKHVD